MNDGSFFGFEGYHIALGAVGATIILAYWLPRFFSNREPAASGLLILIGMLAFAVVPGLPQIPDPRSNALPWELVAELTVIVALFATGLRIDDLSSLSRWGPTIRLLAITMPLTIFAIALLGYSWAGMTVAGAILLGAVLAPTDPVLAGDVQVGPPLEGNEHPVRFALTTEAAINDGLAFPFVYLGLLVAAEGFAPGTWGLEWIGRDILWRIAVGAAMGAAGGWALGQILFVLPRRAPLADTASGVVALAGVLLCYGTTELVEGYGFIAVAVTGLTVRRVEADHQFHRRLHDFTEAIEHALTAVLLVALGAVLPALLSQLSLASAAIAVALVFLIRPLTGWIALAGSPLKGREHWVVAAYGVRGIGSIYYLAYAAGKVEFWDKEQLWALVGFTILLSTLVHGFTAGMAVGNLQAHGEPDQR
ncbi:sodium:proton antiporter [Pseudooceanicola lipolyticus]|uniref:Sodium:proton antiporter n=1 Tax=Pseudooceanicola lipolyticus TaxID=2029104 RepID=A0A2M8J5Y9_9RHOB|nr:cation:proton antiporter [Pseudooceanicola lipolyticus]PJE38188.1 sodium:proton antiporter [Pseudooceanicola lipolyticus]